MLVLASLLVACATATRPPATTTGHAPPTEKTAIDDDPTAEADEGTAEAERDDDASETAASEADSPCPTNMALVEDGEARFCIDRYEASLVEVDADGAERPFSHWLPVDGRVVRAVSVPGVFPQGFISELQAEDACAASGKRLCAPAEWETACMGPSGTTFPYGDERQPGVCHDKGKSAVFAVFGARAFTDPVATTRTKPPPPGRKATATAAKRTKKGAHGKTAAHGPPSKPGKPERQAHVIKGRAAETVRTRPARATSRAAQAEAPTKKTRAGMSNKAANKPSKKAAARGVPNARGAAKASSRPASVEPSVWSQLNDPRLGQVEGALSPTGSHEACVSGYGVFDMVGNLHEWIKTDPAAPTGTFAGGYYLDTAINGDGCRYRTKAHAHDYHDYSTGFRCCADPAAPADP